MIYSANSTIERNNKTGKNSARNTEASLTTLASVIRLSGVEMLTLAPRGAAIAPVAPNLKGLMLVLLGPYLKVYKYYQSK